MVPVTGVGRVYERQRRVRLGDVSPGGRERLDAIARYVQDVSNDDTRDAGLDDEMGWVVRRTVVEVERFPVLGEQLDLVTFCSGIGGRWAERRVGLAGDRGGRVETATLWVHLDLGTGRAKVLPPAFHELFGAAARGRVVRARLQHDDPGAGVVATARPWPTRMVDFDVLGHMNNAVYWAPLEDELARRRDLRAPMRAEVEFRAPIEPSVSIALAVKDGSQGLDAWLVDGDGRVFASASIDATTLSP
jgi:acyl-ACP thioesterase